MTTPRENKAIEEAIAGRNPRNIQKITDQDIEMAIAYIQGVITLTEVGLYLAKSTNQKKQPAMTAYRKLPKILRLAVMRGRITIHKQ